MSSSWLRDRGLVLEDRPSGRNSGEEGSTGSQVPHKQPQHRPPQPSPQQAPPQQVLRNTSRDQGSGNQFAYTVCQICGRFGHTVVGTGFLTLISPLISLKHWRLCLSMIRRIPTGIPILVRLLI